MIEFNNFKEESSLDKLIRFKSELIEKIFQRVIEEADRIRHFQIRLTLEESPRV